MAKKVKKDQSGVRVTEDFVNKLGKSPIKHWLKKLTHEQRIAVLYELRCLEAYGNDSNNPYSKPLGKGLFELKTNKYGLRIYFCFRKNKIIRILNAGDKNTQKNDIRIARARLTQIK